MKTKNIDRQRGGVSIFIVIFACLLLTIVTVSFISIMVRNQEQSTNNDLAASAYDSAMSGVEDAKRLVLQYKHCKDTGDTTGPICGDVVPAVESGDCNTVRQGLYHKTGNDEIKIQSSASDTVSQALDQAYTCVKIRYYTDDVKRTIRDDETQMVPLRAKDNEKFNQVRISWHKRDTGATDSLVLPSDTKLPQKSSWQNRPAVLRTQLLQTAPTFKLTDFDESSSGGSNMNTVFLFPYGAGVTSINLGNTDVRPNVGAREPVSVSCSSSKYSSGDYACQLTMTLPVPVDGTADNRKNAFLVLGSLYNDTDYKLELLWNGTNVPFDGIQPDVDATGRANDLFRRVDARIEFSPRSFDYPNAALDVQNGLCKDFSVTDDPADYSQGRCAP